MPCRCGAERKSPAPSRAARSATSGSGSASRRAVTVATTVPAADRQHARAAARPASPGSARAQHRRARLGQGDRAAEPERQRLGASGSARRPRRAPAPAGRAAAASAARSTARRAAGVWSTGSNEPSASSRVVHRSRRSSEVGPGEVLHQPPRGDRRAATPSTSAVIVTTRSVDCRIRRRTVGSVVVEAEADAAHGRDPAARRRSCGAARTCACRASCDVFRSGSFHTSRRISSRVTTCPARSTSTRSSSNSLFGQARPRRRRRARGGPDSSIRTPPTSTVSGREPAQQRPDPGQQLGEPERLADVVVGARVEADDEVDLVGARGEHEDGEVGDVGPQPAADLEAVHAGQAEVEHEQVDAAPRTRSSATIPSPGDRRPRSPRAARARESGSAIAGVVLGEQDRGHDRSLCRRPRLC